MFRLFKKIGIQLLDVKNLRKMVRILRTCVYWQLHPLHTRCSALGKCA